MTATPPSDDEGVLLSVGLDGGQRVGNGFIRSAECINAFPTDTPGECAVTKFPCRCEERSDLGGTSLEHYRKIRPYPTGRSLFLISA